jgi:hypothetical protein
MAPAAQAREGVGAMTQRFFSNEQYEVFTGWDRPLQMHYVDIYSRDPEGVTGDEHGMIFSSLLMHNPSILPDAIEGKIASYGIPIPVTLRQDLYDDAAQNRGNLHVNYDLGIAQDMETLEMTTLPDSVIEQAVVPIGVEPWMERDGDPEGAHAASGQATRDATTPSSLLVTRVRELAERVQGWFHSRDQDRGMDR